jgi:hypothetical protein
MTGKVLPFTWGYVSYFMYQHQDIDFCSFVWLFDIHSNNRIIKMERRWVSERKNTNKRTNKIKKCRVTVFLVDILKKN